MSNSRKIKQYPITWTNDLSQPIFCGDFRNIGITIVGTGDIQVLGTKDINKVDFSASSTLSNSFAAIVIADETVANTYSTTISVSASTKLAEVNTNDLQYICLSRSGSGVDAFVSLTDNL